jgi:uncharacterized membrane protein
MTSSEPRHWLSASGLSYLVALKSQVWAVPALVTVVLGALAVAMLHWGRAIETALDGAWWLYNGDATTARDLLGAILSGLITMTSLVLSMTFVVLTLAANQLGPRIVSILTGDRQVQLAIGLFVGTIVYVLVVLRTLNDALGPEGVPHAAISAASLLTVLCLLVLLFYVHKISRMIVSDVVVDRISHDLRRSLDDALERADPDRAARQQTTPPPPERWLPIAVSGYVQAIDYGRLTEVACDTATVLHIAVRPGEFVLRHGPHVGVAGATTLDDKSVARIRDAFVVGGERSPAQDLEYAIRQLVESALRALSSGLNDQFTVVAVVDKLGEALEDLMGDRQLPDLLCRDEEGALRVVGARTSLPELVGSALDPIRQAAGGDPVVLGHLADTIGKLRAVATRPQTRALLGIHLDSLEATARATLSVEPDREACIDRISAARRATGSRPWIAGTRRDAAAA